MVYNRGRAKGNSSHLPLAYITSLAFLAGCTKTLPMYEPLSPIKFSEVSPSVLASHTTSPLTQDQACEAVGLALLKGIKDNHKIGYTELDEAFILSTDRSIISLYTAPLKSCDTFLEYVSTLNDKLRPLLKQDLVDNPISPYSFEANPEILKLVGNNGDAQAQHASASRLESLCLGEHTQGIMTPLDEFAQYLYILNTLSSTQSQGITYLAAPKEQLNEIVQRKWAPEK